MNTKVYLVIFVAIFLRCNHQKDEILFPIYENNRIGFINNKGRLVIEPKFRSAGNFSEGLAAARVNGNYGFIDKTGQFIIEPKFEFATDFKEGYAIVYNGSKPSFVDKKGSVPFITNFNRLEPFENGRSLVTTLSEKMGMIDKQGKLVIDTIYARVERFESHLFYVKNIRKNEEEEVGLMDSLGRFVVPFGKFQQIGLFNEGFAKVVTSPKKGDRTGESGQTGFINADGNILFLRQDNLKEGCIFGDMYNGVAEIKFYKYWIPEEEGIEYSSEKEYEGFVNINGSVVFKDTSITRVTNFSNGRAFIMDKSLEFYLIDQNFQKVTAQKFEDVTTGFDKGFAFVKVSGYDDYGLIDTSGNFVFQPQFRITHNSGILGDYFFFGIDSPTEKNKYRILYGIANVSGKIMVQPLFEYFDPNGFVDGLLKVMIDGKLSYINRKGVIIWQEQKNKSIEDFNITYKKDGHFHALSVLNTNDYYRFDSAYSVPKPITSELDFPENKLAIVLDINDVGLYDNKWNGYKLCISNLSNKPVSFQAQDNRLNMKIQARNIKGDWQDIESLPNSWCGVSYHTLTLKNAYYWDFMIPKYNGDFATRLRVQLEYNNSDSSDEPEKEVYTKPITIYSREFDGGVNLSQFWRGQTPAPNGILDTYSQ